MSLWLVPIIYVSIDQCCHAFMLNLMLNWNGQFFVKLLGQVFSIQHDCMNTFLIRSNDLDIQLGKY